MGTVKAEPGRGEDVKQGTVVAVCTSKKKGTPKTDVGEAMLRKDHGIEGDAHAGPKGHRQVSLLAEESIGRMQELGLAVGPGDFAENFTTRGLELPSLPIGTCLEVGQEVLLEVTQIGKECPSPCGVYRRIGRCVMPEEGIFCSVKRGGRVQTGDAVTVGPESPGKTRPARRIP